MNTQQEVREILLNLFKKLGIQELEYVAPKNIRILFTEIKEVK